MSLIDDLRRIHLPPSHIPTANEIASVLGHLVAFVEHGPELFKAAEKDAEALNNGELAKHVDELLSPPPPEPPPAPAAPPSTPAGAAADPRDAEIAALKQQLQNATAAQQSTTVTPLVPGEPTPEPPAEA